METVRVNGAKYIVPTNWKELAQDPELYKFAISLFFKQLSEYELRLMFAYRVLHISKITQIRLTRLSKRNPNAFHARYIFTGLFQLIELFRFLTEKQPEDVQVFPKLYRIRPHYAPRTMLAHTGIWEYAIAEDAFFQFGETQDFEHLDRLIATLYRPRKAFWFTMPKTADRRLKFDEYSMDAFVEHAKKMSIQTKWMIYRWFAKEREGIIKLFPYVFKKLNENASPTEADDRGWWDTIIAMSPVGEEERTANTSMALILSRINAQNKEHERMKREAERMKNRTK